MSKRGRLSARGMGLATAVVMWLAPAGAQAQQNAGSAKIAAAQDVVTLLSVKSVYAEPSLAGQPLATVIDERPITLVRTTLPVLDEAKNANGRAWLRVRLPGRVFGRKTPPPTGWITASDTRRGQTAWHLVVDVDARRVVAYHKGVRKRSFRVIVGKPSTPTPRGKYFVEETMRLPAGHVGAPFALATSARSRVFWSFMGGPGQVALHGVKNIGGTMGTAVSNGCVRMTSDAIVWLAQRIQAGVPLTIR